MADNPLGKQVSYPEHYDPKILHAIPRAASRKLLGIDGQFTMHGVDHWHAFELSWLDKQGRPQVGCGEFVFTADSINIIESKSLKLYLHSLNNQSFKDGHNYASVVSTDLSRITQSNVQVTVRALDEPHLIQLSAPAGKCIDDAQLQKIVRPADAGLLRATCADSGSKAVYSNLFRSNCPITGQPDWATVQIEYAGSQVNESDLLSYLCSYRQHLGYHEDCAERIFKDIMINCQPDMLTVGMNFLRRGGLDINPYRSTEPVLADKFNFRLVRQ